MKLPTTILADDHAILLEGLQRLLEGHVNVIATCTDGETLLAETLRLKPELVITDISMPVMTGLQYIRAADRAGHRPKVIVLSMYDNERIIATAFSSGAMAFLTKQTAGEELIDAIHEVMAGRVYLSRILSHATERPVALEPASLNVSLSRRQREVLKLVAEGKTMKEIAGVLNLSRRTVEMHKYHMMRALGLGTTAELISFFVRHQHAIDHVNHPLADVNHPLVDL